METVENISHLESELENVNDFKAYRVAFYITRDGVRLRQVVALDGYFIKALMRKGIDRADIPKWTQQAVNHWEVFDAKLPITAQVKLLITRFIQDVHPFGSAL